MVFVVIVVTVMAFVIVTMAVIAIVMVVVMMRTPNPSHCNDQHYNGVSIPLLQKSKGLFFFSFRFVMSFSGKKCWKWPQHL